MLSGINEELALPLLARRPVIPKGAKSGRASEAEG